LTSGDLSRLKRWFDLYTSGFMKGDPAYDRALRLKVDHTRRVCREIALLGKAAGLPAPDGFLAVTAALFHDIGRFRQYEIHRTFSDRNSENHAHLGLRVIAAERLFHGIPMGERRLVMRAVAFHNAARPPVIDDPRSRQLISLLRDADKLDIWRVFIRHYREAGPGADVISLGLPEIPPCSPAILNALSEGRLASMNDLETRNDLRLLQISWVYDLNFPASFRAVKKRRYIERIASGFMIPEGDAAAVSAAVDKAIRFVKSRLPQEAECALSC
jgi:hypothetical protein